MKTIKRLYLKPPIKDTLNTVVQCANKTFILDSFLFSLKSFLSFAVHQHHHHFIH